MLEHDSDFASYEHSLLIAHEPVVNVPPSVPSCSGGAVQLVVVSAVEAIGLAFFSHHRTPADPNADAITVAELFLRQLTASPRNDFSAPSLVRGTIPLAPQPRKGEVGRYTSTTEDIEMSLDIVASPASTEHNGRDAKSARLGDHR